MTDSVKIPVIDRSGRLPEYATPGAAGMDVRAMLDSPVTIHPGGRAGIPLLNSPGTIDSDYRGEIGVILANLSAEPFIVADGDRIAQMVVARYATVEWIPAETLSDTDRGNGGFGHTGKN